MLDALRSLTTLLKWALFPLPLKHFYLFFTMLSLYCSVDFALAAVHGLLIAVVSLVAEPRLQGTQASIVAVHGLSSCGA